MVRRDPDFFCWPSVFLEAWGTKAKKAHILQKRVVFWPCRLRRQDQRTILFCNKVLFFGLGTPGLHKTTWPTNHFGIPLKHGD
jgi:hypothetical protein